MEDGRMAGLLIALALSMGLNVALGYVVWTKHIEDD